MPTGLSVMRKGTPMLPRSWRHACKTDSWMKRLSGMTSEPSTADAGVESFISSLLDTPAPPCPPLGSASASATPDGSGPRSQELSLSAGLHTSSSKTSAAIFDSPSTMFGLTWEQWATSVRQDFSRRRKLARRTNVNASSSWPTPSSNQFEGGEAWQERREREKAKGINGNGFGLT